ncbi:MAG TPA: hypothetical protein PLZ38_00635 [Spirochaetota bacterium]|nr:hypothetical protein [Spirochaetota bacterium]HOM87310.1 hypothetical protein [Spirochaetota bacterium]HOR92463.1 hypothetical protein [Spirochaetota bacterium]HOT18831.1 hypothetical protein [Spirochaetota bacterium]HPD04807.1 hypothetical protein [Spirochaetota bacterium]
MKKILIICVGVVCLSCTRYVELGDVEFTVNVTFEKNVPVFASTYTIYINNKSVDTVITSYSAVVSILDEEQKAVKQCTVTAEQILPKQQKQLFVQQKDSEDTIKVLLDALEISVDELIKQREAALVLPARMVRVDNVTYKTVDIVTYLKEVEK